MDVQRLSEGLWRWTGVHPEWEPEAEYGVPREVGSVYYEAADAVVLIDPIIPSEDRERFLDALDRDVERAGRPVAILLTSHWHGRSSAELAERYGGEIRAAGEFAGAKPFALGDTLPGGVETFDAHFHGEALLWIPAHGTLVSGDMLSVANGRLRVAPDEWLPAEEQGGQMRASLAFLLDLPVQRVLVGHGEAVLANARDALVHALHAPSAS